MNDTMAKSKLESNGSQKNQMSITRWFIIFSVSLFLFILTGGSIAFIFSMRQIIRTNKGQELSQMLEIERIKLEASVNNEISIALKMARSPLIQEYFANPGDRELSRIAFTEISAYRVAFANNSLFWVNDIDRLFYSDDSEPFWVDAQNPDNYWYNMTLYETEVYNFNINYNPDLQVTNLWINAPVFYSNRKPIGIVGTGIDLSTFIDSLYKDYSNTAQLYFFNDAGEITGARDVGLVAAKKNIEQELGETGSGIIAAAKNLNPGETKVLNTSMGNIAIGTVPILEWYTAAFMPDSISDYNTAMTWLFLVVLAVILVVFIIFNFILAKLFVKPLKTVVSVLQEISEDWNLTRRIDSKNVESIAEISEISKIFNLTFDNFKNLVDVIKNKTHALTNTVFELSSSAKEITTTANEQSASVAEIVSTMENNKNLSSQAAAKTVEVAELSDKTRELSRRGADLRDANENMMLDIRSQNAKITDVIRNLADMLSGIDESVQLIDTIADHTKLIAFNATLEASSSGEAGLRFAVVAGEIRRFADNVVESAAEIKEKISELQEASQTLITEADNGSRAIDSGYQRMIEQKEVFENIVDTSQNVAIRSQQITNLSKQQELASSQVFIALKEISAGVNQFVTATGMTSATMDRLNSMSVELKETLAKYQTNNRRDT